MKTFKKWGVVFLCLAAFTAAVGAFLMQMVPLGSVRVCIPNLPASFLIILSNEASFFKKKNLSVEIHQRQLSRQCVADLVRGDVDLSASWVTPVVSVLKDNPDIRIVTQLHYSNSYTSMVARWDGKGEFDIRGKKVAYVQGTTGERLIHVFLKSRGLNFDDIEAIVVPRGEMFDLAKSGRVDVIATGFPQRQKILKLEGFRNLATPFHMEMSVLAMKSALQTERPEIADAMLASLVDAWDFFLKDQDEALKYVRRYFARERRKDELFIDLKNAEPSLGLTASLVQLMGYELDRYDIQAKPVDFFYDEPLLHLAPELVTHQ